MQSAGGRRIPAVFLLECAGHDPHGAHHGSRHPAHLDLYIPATEHFFLLKQNAQVMTRMGAIMAAGILDAGGRNATVGLRSRAGHFRWAGNDGALAVLRAGAGQPRSGRRAAAGTAAARRM